MINLDDLVWVELPSPDDFLIVKETLTRIGIASKKNNTLYQSCHILHKQGKYAILHFKELFLLDGKSSDLSESDIARRNTIVNLLAKWGLVNLVDPEKSKAPVVPESDIRVLSHKEKDNWVLQSKYNIGHKK